MEMSEYTEKLQKLTAELEKVIARNYISEQACWVMADYITKREPKYQDSQSKIVERARDLVRIDLRKRRNINNV